MDGFPVWQYFLHALSPNVSRQLDTLQAQLATGIHGNDHAEASSNLDLRRRRVRVPVIWTDPLFQVVFKKTPQLIGRSRDCDLIKLLRFASWIFFLRYLVPWCQTIGRLVRHGA